MIMRYIESVTNIMTRTSGIVIVKMSRHLCQPVPDLVTIICLPITLWPAADTDRRSPTLLPSQPRQHPDWTD
jgi:hypothetical protein